jgi:hypothetical protein
MIGYFFHMCGQILIIGTFFSTMNSEWTKYCLLLRRKALILAVQKSNHNKSVARNNIVPVVQLSSVLKLIQHNFLLFSDFYLFVV